MRPFRKNSVTCSFWKLSVSRLRLVRAFPKFAHFVKKFTGKRSARYRCSLHRLLRSANLMELLVRILFSASSLVLQSVRSGNWLELLVRVTCSAPFLTKPIRNAPLAVVPGFSRFLWEFHTPPFCNSAACSRNPRENAPLGVVARSAGLFVPWICSFRQNTVTDSALLLKATVSSRNPREKQSARRRHSFRKVFDSGIRSKCTSASRARRRCSLCPFPDEILVKTLSSASLESFVSPRKCTRIARPRHRLGYSTRRFECRLVVCVLAVFACQLDSAKVFTERFRSTGPDIAGPLAYR